MTSLGRKGWRWKAGRSVYVLSYAFVASVHIANASLYNMVSPRRWWRGREHLQKSERNMKGFREIKKREDCSKERIPRFNLLFLS